MIINGMHATSKIKTRIGRRDDRTGGKKSDSKRAKEREREKAIRRGQKSTTSKHRTCMYSSHDGHQEKKEGTKKTREERMANCMPTEESSFFLYAHHKHLSTDEYKGSGNGDFSFPLQSVLLLLCLPLLFLMLLSSSPYYSLLAMIRFMRDCV